MPMNFAEADNGMLIMCDGFGPALRWDGLTGVADTAGVLAPTAAPVLSANNYPGQIVGDYNAYVRFVDQYGNVSNLSPISNDITAQSSTGTITGASNTTPIQITSPGHGLYSGVWVSISGVGGNVGANGTWEIQVVDANTFNLLDSAGTGSGVTAPVGSGGVGGEGRWASSRCLKARPRPPRAFTTAAAPGSPARMPLSTTTCRCPRNRRWSGGRY